MLKTGFVLNLYRAFLWLITVISAVTIGRLWGRKTEVEKVQEASIARDAVEVEVLSKDDKAVRKELQKWVRYKK